METDKDRSSPAGKLHGRLLSPWAWGVTGILVAALCLRLPSLGFGLPALNDPDELMFELGAIRMLKGPTLNPGWFGHPATTTMYALAVVNALVFAWGWAAGWFAGPAAFAEAVYTDPTWMILPGRAMILACGLAVIVLAYRLGARLFGRSAGLAAAALLAVSPLHVKFSQIIRSDMMACVFMLACLLAALRVARDGRLRDYAWAALWLGLAIATKWPFAAVALGVIGAGAMRMVADRAGAGRELRRLMLFGAMAIATLLAVSPYLLIDFATVAANLQGEAQPHHLGATGGSPWWNLRWYVANSLLGGLGLAGLALAAVGLVLGGQHRDARAVVLPVIAGIVVLLVTQRLVWDRWVLPLLPLLAILAGNAAARLCSRLPRSMHLPGALLLAFAAGTPLALETMAQARERMDDTRQQASRWLLDHAQPGDTVLIEHFAFDLMGAPYRFLFPLGEAGCVDARALLRGQVSYATVEKLRKARSNVDYGTLPPGKAGTCHADYAILTEFDRYAAERHRFPAEYGAYAALLARGKIVASFFPVRGKSAGRIVRIVHFAPEAR